MSETKVLERMWKEGYNCVDMDNNGIPLRAWKTNMSSNQWVDQVAEYLKNWQHLFLGVFILMEM
jgi:hypothetical protein